MQNLNLYTSNFSKVNHEKRLTNGERFSVMYHDIFNYPLTLSEIIKWKANDLELSSHPVVDSRSGYLFIEGKEGDIYKRLLRQRSSKRKMITAKKYIRIISFVPTIKMIGITGALAMENAEESSDIDLMIITSGGSLWLTRLISYFVMKLSGVKVRRPGEINQKDKLCMNIWLDEKSLTWSKKDRNIYTAHEIAQVVPVVNKDKAYEKFIYQNRWIQDFWPNAVKIRPTKIKKQNGYSLITNAFEKIAFLIQKNYMKSKITREVVTPTKALFHPQDWGSFVLRRLTS